MSDFKKTVRDFADKQFPVIYGKSPGMDVTYNQCATISYMEGAKEAAKLTQELGEILQSVEPALTAKQLMQCRDIFARNKEIVDCE